jgi:hypothetical protein
MRFLDEIVVAWAAPNGAIQEGRPGALMAMYAFQTAAPTASEGSVRPDTEVSTPNPADPRRMASATS